MNDLTLVFDLDGTVVDSAPDLIRAANHILDTQNLSAIDPALLRSQISFGARAMIERALGIHGITATASKLDFLFDDFLVYYQENIAVESRPYPGIETILKVQRQHGTRLAICTNKIEKIARSLLKALHLEDAFDVIAGRDTYDVFKPDPGHLTQTIAAANGSAQKSVMIGDSQTDLSTAHNAKIPVIGVTFGYSDPPMRELQPTVMIDSYAQFDDRLSDILIRGKLTTHLKATKF